MNKLTFAALLLAAASVASAQVINLKWSQQFSLLGSDLSPRCLTPVDSGGGVFSIFAGVWSPTNSTGRVVKMGAASSQEVSLTNGGAVANFAPEFISFLNPDLGQFEPEVLGLQTTGVRKVKFFGSDTNPSPTIISGNLDYTYRFDQPTLDEPLSLGAFPYSTYGAANIQTNSGRQLVVLDTVANQVNPLVRFTDTSISPASSVVSGNLVLAAGVDNAASSLGGARAAGYKINQDRSVSAAFTKVFANSLAGGVFTSHDLLWASFSNSFNVLVDNRTVHDGNANSKTYNYVLNAYDGTGQLLWTTTPRSGTIFQTSVGSTSSVYVLGTHGPGQFVVSYAPGGVLRWARSTKAVRIAAAFDQGVVTGDNEVDGTGHHHIHLTKIAFNKSIAWTTTYSSQTTNDDLLTNLQWTKGRVFLAGQFSPLVGNKGIFGAEYVDAGVDFGSNGRIFFATSGTGALSQGLYSCLGDGTDLHKHMSNYLFAGLACDPECAQAYFADTNGGLNITPLGSYNPKSLPSVGHIGANYSLNELCLLDPLHLVTGQRDPSLVGHGGLTVFNTRDWTNVTFSGTPGEEFGSVARIDDTHFVHTGPPSFGGYSHVYIHNMGNGSETDINVPVIDCFVGSYDPIGDWVYIAVENDPNHQGMKFVARVHSTGLGYQQLTTPLAASPFSLNPVVSPDGNLVVFQRQAQWLNSSGWFVTQGHFQLCVMNSDGSNIRVLYEGDAPIEIMGWFKPS